jgi:hypothetical protein
LAYQTFFLNVVVPGHTRGVITLTGQAGTDQIEGCGCCESKPAKSKDAPTSKDRQNCAICNLAAHYTLPPVVDFRLADLGLLALLPVSTAATIHPADFIPTYYACGPPPLV